MPAHRKPRRPPSPGERLYITIAALVALGVTVVTLALTVWT